MQSIWTTSESEAILPSTSRAPDLPELMGDPDHDQTNCHQPRSRAEHGSGFTDSYTSRAAKAAKTLPKRPSATSLQKQATNTPHMQHPHPPRRPHPSWLIVPSINRRNHSKSDYFKEFR